METGVKRDRSRNKLYLKSAIYWEVKNERVKSNYCG